MKTALAVLVCLGVGLFIISSARVKRQQSRTGLVAFACKRRPTLPYCPKAATTAKEETTTEAPTTETIETTTEKETTTTKRTTTTTTTPKTTKRTTTKKRTTPKATTTTTKIEYVTPPKVVDYSQYCRQYKDHYYYYCGNIQNHPIELQPKLHNYCPLYIKHCNPPKATPAPFRPPAPVAPQPRRNPDAVFMQCCQNDKRMERSCHYLCRFSNINKQQLIDAFLRQTCRGASPRYVINCASSGVDHRACCTRQGLSTFNGGQCMPFCDPTHHGHIDMGIGAMPCLDIMSKIVQCYVNGMP